MAGQPWQRQPNSDFLLVRYFYGEKFSFLILLSFFFLVEILRVRGQRTRTDSKGFQSKATRGSTFSCIFLSLLGFKKTLVDS